MHFTLPSDWLREQLNKALRSKFVRNAASLMLYTITGQLITVAASLVLTRIYAPRDFGFFGILLSFPALLGNAICLNFNFAAPAPVRDEDGAAIAFGAAAIATIMSIFLSLVFLALVLTNQLGFGVLPKWSWLIVWVMLFVSGITSILQYWCVRRQRFKQMGESVIVLNGTRAALQVTLGLLSASWAGLAVGEIAGRAAQLNRYLLATWTDLHRFRAAAAPRIILRALLRYRRFTTVLLPPMLLDSVAAAIPIPLLNLLFGLTVTGQYYLMRRVLDLPVAIISSTVADAFYGRISEYTRTDPSRIRRMLVVVFVTLVALSAAAFSPLVIFGPSIFTIAFGPLWKQAGLLAAIMTPAMIVQIGTSPVSRVFGVTKKPNLFYPFNVMRLMGSAAVFGAAWLYRLNIVSTVAALSLVYVASYLVYIITAYIAASHIDSEA